MTPPNTHGQDTASIAVLQAQQVHIGQQLDELKRVNSAQLSEISSKLDKLSEMGLEMGRIKQTTVHQAETLARAHGRLDTLEKDFNEHLSESSNWRDQQVSKLDAKLAPLAVKVDAVAATQNRWTGGYIGVQVVIGALFGIILWLANGYISKVDQIGKDINRIDRQIDRINTNREERQ